MLVMNREGVNINFKQIIFFYIYFSICTTIDSEWSKRTLREFNIKRKSFQNTYFYFSAYSAFHAFNGSREHYVDKRKDRGSKDRSISFT